MFKTWLRKYSLPILVIVSIAILLISLIPPKECVLCTEAPHHAPCLLNLSTGEIEELTVYDPHQVNSKILSEEQTTGTFSFLHKSDRFYPKRKNGGSKASTSLLG